MQVALLQHYNYKSSSRKFSSGVSVIQAELSKHFTETNHHGFLEDVSFHIIDRMFGVSRYKKGFITELYA